MILLERDSSYCDKQLTRLVLQLVSSQLLRGTVAGLLQPPTPEIMQFHYTVKLDLGLLTAAYPVLQL
jgi:hypothetical protein